MKEDKNKEKDLFEDLFRNTTAESTPAGFTENVMKEINGSEEMEYNPIMNQRKWGIAASVFILIGLSGWLTQSQSSMEETIPFLESLASSTKSLMSNLSGESLKYFLFGFIGISLYFIMDKTLIVSRR